MKSVYVVIMNCNGFCCSFTFYIFLFLNDESLVVVRLGWVCVRACGGAHRRKSRLCRGIYF